MDDHDLERRLRRFTPEAPPAHLRSRVLRAAGADEDRPPGLRRSWQRSVLLHAAAVLLIAASIPLNRWIDNEGSVPDQAAPARRTDWSAGDPAIDRQVARLIRFRDRAGHRPLGQAAWRLMSLREVR